MSPSDFIAGICDSIHIKYDGYKITESKISYNRMNTDSKFEYLSDTEEVWLGEYSTRIRRLTIADRVITLPAKFVSIVDNKVYSGNNYFPIDKLIKAIDEHKNFSASIINLDCRLLDYTIIRKLIGKDSSYLLPYSKTDEFLAGVSSVVAFEYADNIAKYYNISYVYRYGDSLPNKADSTYGDTVYVDWRWYPERI